MLGELMLSYLKPTEDPRGEGIQPMPHTNMKALEFRSSDCNTTETHTNPHSEAEERSTSWVEMKTVHIYTD